MNNEKVFISGSLSIKVLPKETEETIDKIMNKNVEILVGDAPGIDKLIQKYCFKKKYDRITIYYVGNKTRNLENETFATKKVNISDEDKTEKAKQSRKDIKMTKDSTYSFVIWDEKSSGSYANIMRSLEENKYVKVYLASSNKYIHSKEPNFKNEIKDIYTTNSGFTKEKCLELLKESYPENLNLKNNNTFNEFLVKNKILMKDGKKYIPTDEYKNFFIKKIYKGKFDNYNFTNDLFDQIDKLIKSQSEPLLPLL